MFPDYKQIYTDIIHEKYPEKISDTRIRGKIETINTVMDILDLNKLIFGETKLITESNNQKLRSYDKKSILKILNYQKKHGLNNTEVASHFKMSRNTIAKWRTVFENEY